MIYTGDVLTVVAILAGLCVTAWALIMASALLFQSSATRAKESCMASPWKGLGLGLLTTLVLGLAAIISFNVPNPIAKLIATSLYLTLMALAALGASGVALVIADRVSNLDKEVSHYNALRRAAAVLVISAIFPLLGWLLVGPLLFVGSIGFGLLALPGKRAPYAVPPRADGSL